MRVVFFTAGKNDPSARFRAEQFFPFLEASGVQCVEFKSYPQKYYVPATSNKYLFILFFGFFLALKTLTRLVQIPCVLFADAVFIQRELVPFGLIPLEKIVSYFNRNIIFDFDDSIFTYKNQFAPLLLKIDPVPKIIKFSKTVIVGNSFLYHYASQYNERVFIIPTVVDTGRYTVKSGEKQSNTITIGWIGTHSNLKYVAAISKAFDKIKKGNLHLKIVSDRPENLAEIKTHIPTQFKQWAKADEITDLQSFDIGIMPLVEDEWAKGKCGFKLLQYMSVGVPVVASAVGINSEILGSNQYGLLATTIDDWSHNLSLLIENKGNIRQRFAQRGRERVEKAYSLQCAQMELLKLIEKTVTIKSK